MAILRCFNTSHRGAGLAKGSCISRQINWRRLLLLGVRNHFVVYTTFHHPVSGANVITTENSDWATNCPEYKVTAVQVTVSKQANLKRRKVGASGIQGAQTPPSAFLARGDCILRASGDARCGARRSVTASGCAHRRRRLPDDGPGTVFPLPAIEQCNRAPPEQ